MSKHLYAYTAHTYLCMRARVCFILESPLELGDWFRVDHYPMKYIFDVQTSDLDYKNTRDKLIRTCSRSEATLASHLCAA